MPNSWWENKLRKIGEGLKESNENFNKLFDDPDYIRTPEGQATIQSVLENMPVGGFGIIGGKGAKLFSGAKNKFSAMWDNLMRFEIDDSKMVVKKGFENVQKLGDLVEHKELFDNYPKLKDLPIYVSKLRLGENAGVLGQTSGSGIRLFVPESQKVLKEKNFRTLIHEVQHVIQDIEGFAKGGTPEAMMRKVDRVNDIVVTQMGRDPMYLRAKEALKRGDLSIESFMEHPDVTKYSKKLTTAEKLYKQLAGEIEARDVSKRMGLSRLQRSAIAPYSSERTPVNEWITEGIGKIYDVPK